MVSKAETIGGFHYQFVEDSPDSLKCLICLLVVREARQHSGCGKLFCKSCIAEYKRRGNGNVCPHCRAEPLKTFKDGRSILEVKSLKVRCENEGCLWVNELRLLEEHLETCEHTLVPCPNQCECDLLPKRNLKYHIENECIKRQWHCVHCGELGEYRERTTSHLEDCTDVRIECPNDGCDAQIKRRKVDYHVSFCDYEPVPCKYAVVGCPETPFRKDLGNHEKEGQLHLKLTVDKVVELSARLTSEEKKVAKLEKKILEHSQFRFKVTRVEQLKRENKQFHSRPFYSSRFGYRMRVEVDVSGQDDGESTHVSVFIYLIKGSHDNSLTWPFTGTVTIELLNQLEDKNHRKRVLTFPLEVGDTVVNGTQETGYGYSRFISQTELALKQSKNRQYLKDDTLLFRVFVETSDCNYD